MQHEHFPRSFPSLGFVHPNWEIKQLFKMPLHFFMVIKKNYVHCFTFLLGKKKQWFQTVLLWEPEALQVDKALSGNGVHVQAGCSE